MCLSRRLCLRACVLWDSVKCIIGICLFAFKRRRVLTYADHADERRLSLGIGKFSLISCGSGCMLHFFWTVFQLDVPVARLKGLPKVDASCVGCQKVKVPYLF